MHLFYCFIMDAFRLPDQRYNGGTTDSYFMKITNVT